MLESVKLGRTVRFVSLAGRNQVMDATARMTNMMMMMAEQREREREREKTATEVSRPDGERAIVVGGGGGGGAHLLLRLRHVEQA